MKSRELIYLAGGCFWCTEAIFRSIKGVTNVLPGYMGGSVLNPTYAEVSSGKSNHAEVVQIEYDRGKTELTDILFIFFNTHDPTTLNRQGNDIGSQYRSAIFYANDQQKSIIAMVLKRLQKESVYENPIVTQVAKAEVFYPAEEYHRAYYSKNENSSYCQFVIRPKLERLQEYFTAYIKKSARMNSI